ncbi:hypothetical protein B0O99DRAFT_595624 [Bisporella sp. PMI_857]|nr:hypothetical protein B0O99DRAFT_595624 [Bisporella sp. PMI_857]
MMVVFGDEVVVTERGRAIDVLASVQTQVPQGFFIFNGTEVKEDPSPTSPDRSSVTTTTMTRIALASGNATCPTGGKQAAENKSPEQNNDSEMVKKNTAIGAAVGGALGGAAFLGIAQFFIFRSIFRRKLERGLSGTGTRIHLPPQGDTDKGLVQATTVYSGHDNRPPLPEVDGRPHMRHELLGGGQL